MTRTNVVAKEFQAILRHMQKVAGMLMVAEGKQHASKNGHTNGVTPARVLHGRYMGLTRTLRPRQRTKCRNIRITHGVRAAIAQAKKFREG